MRRLTCAILARLSPSSRPPARWRSPQAAPRPEAAPAETQAPITPEQVRQPSTGSAPSISRSDPRLPGPSARADAAVAVPALLAAVKQHTDEYVRFRALVILSGFNDPRTRDVMVAAVTDKNDRMRDRRLRVLRA